jgi:hypothetical protein
MASESIERRAWLPAYVISIQVVTTILLWIRIGGRLTGKSTSGLGIDDVLIVIAWILGTTLAALAILGAM